MLFTWMGCIAAAAAVIVALSSAAAAACGMHDLLTKRNALEKRSKEDRKQKTKSEQHLGCRLRLQTLGPDDNDR